MNDEARDLDQLVRGWWLNTRTEELFQRILSQAVSAEIASLIPFARALQILETQQLRPKISQRVDELRLRLDHLRIREQQIDTLGDLNNDPQILFEILKTDVEQIDRFDPDSLRKARVAHPETRGSAARAFLESLGEDQLPGDVWKSFQTAAADVIDREQYQAWGLFVDRDSAQGLALGIKFVLRDSGERLFSEANSELKQQVHIAADLALEGKPWSTVIEWPAQFDGESIGLPLYLAALTARGEIQNHALTASSGKLGIDGRVQGVSGIKAKVASAQQIGIRRLLVARDNFEEATSVAGENLIVLPVDHVREVRGLFQQSMSQAEVGYSALIQLVRASVRGYNLVVQDEIDNNQGYRFVVANAAGNAQIWVHRNSHVRTDGSPGPALDAANKLIAEQMPSAPLPRGNLSFKLPTVPLQEDFRRRILELGAIDETIHQNEKWCMRLHQARSCATVVLYTTGTCLIKPGTAPAWDAIQTVADRTLASIGGLVIPLPKDLGGKSASPKTLESELQPHIGTDEAGKGDYFGPLVSAAVFVNQESAVRLRQLGVRDSKTIADPKIRELAEKIRQMPDVRCAVTPINPRKYNDLYETFRKEGKNLNSLLAWGHGKSIETLLSAPGNRGLGAKYVVVDQFADKHYVEQRTRGAGIPVYQRHKAEEDIAVAAASILARDGFLKWLERMSQRTQIVLPKGASPAVIAAAKQFVRKWGAKWLTEVAKLHFRTTSQVLQGEESNVDQHPPKWAADESGIQGES